MIKISRFCFPSTNCLLTYEEVVSKSFQPIFSILVIPFWYYKIVCDFKSVLKFLGAISKNLYDLRYLWAKDYE